MHLANDTAIWQHCWNCQPQDEMSWDTKMPQWPCSLLSQSLIIPHCLKRLYSVSQKKSKCLKTRLKSYSDQSFFVRAPTKWNKLPLSLKSAPNLSSFKSQLKTFLFKEHYKKFLNSYLDSLNHLRLSYNRLLRAVYGCKMCKIARTT